MNAGLTMITLKAVAMLNGEVQQVEQSVAYDGMDIARLEKSLQIDTPVGPVAVTVTIAFDPPVVTEIGEP